ncbi:MAG: histidine kinase [Bacteroidales bacterium]|nr:histidine kinase [Bacteroidales bacterium]MCB8999377.1 histidine kinase [Bacteroidales bacterium]
MGYINPFDKRFLIVAMAIGILLPLIFFLSGYMDNRETPLAEGLFAGAFTFLITITITFVNTRIAIVLSKKYPWKDGWTKRLVIELLITSISAAIIISIVVALLYKYSAFHNQYSFNFTIFQNALIAIIINLILMTIMEGRELFQMYRNSILEAEILKRQNIESQYTALSNQVNPHFLFNNLNVLSFLISSDPEKAQEFINRFSLIYRYVLDVKDKSLVSLKEEVDFLQAYLFLQKTRYEDKLDFKIEIPQDKLEYFLPPLSLQILIENAIKHNEISVLNPMHIEIKVDGNSLLVKNPLNPRKDKEPSTGFGLKHLVARYGHFTEKKPVFGPRGEYFEAKIPLLQE